MTSLLVCYVWFIFSILITLSYLDFALLYPSLKLLYFYTHSQAPFLGLCHWNQETRLGRWKQSVRIPAIISSTPTSALLPLPRGWAPFIRHWRWILPSEPGQLYHQTLRGLQPSKSTWHIRHMHTHWHSISYQYKHFVSRFACPLIKLSWQLNRNAQSYTISYTYTYT